MDKARLEEIRGRVEAAKSALGHCGFSTYYPFDDMVELLEYVDELEKKVTKIK